MSVKFVCLPPVHATTITTTIRINPEKTDWQKPRQRAKKQLKNKREAMRILKCKKVKQLAVVVISSRPFPVVE